MKTSASITVNEPGPFRQGDTVTFTVIGDGVLSAYGSRDGAVVVSWALGPGEHALTITPSLSWTDGPIHVDVALRALVSHTVKTLARTSFEVIA